MRLDELIQQHTQALSPVHQTEVFDFVLFLEQKQARGILTKEQPQRQERLKKALDAAVALDIFKRVDGVAWQQEQRMD